MKFSSNIEGRADLMAEVKIKLNTRESTGKIRKLNGGNLGPQLAGEMSGSYMRDSYKELNLAFARMHDAPLCNANCPMVDISSIFPLFHLDENCRENYRFVHTDDYFHNCIVDAGTPVFYRLGESIDHSINKYFITPPKDVDKWINIASNIIRHYTEGLWDGFHYNIEYWEIWNEPNLGGNKRLDPNAKNLMWLGTQEEFYAFFGKVAKELKKRFPHLKIGGPAHSGFSEEVSGPFIKYCAENNVPLDFYSYHGYDGDPKGWLQKTPVLAREMLDKYGYKDTEIHLNEWHYFPGDWHRLRTDAVYKKNMYNNEMKGIDSAAFLNMVMTLWQDSPITYGGYYTCNNSAWGCYETASNSPTASFFGLKAYGEIVRYPERFAASSDNENVVVLAGKNTSGEKCVLITGFKTSVMDYIVELDECVKAEDVEVRLIDENHMLSVQENAIVEGNTIKFSHRSYSMVALIKIR